ncbi:hypothetical protein NP233_g10712 [Leucocoprinus birnbaumii]|uniref:endo-polygalacturonase n=1 Tax=Leucocoprinus birnbaumii TaxID=56174 RepID=A0AAD5VK85_9AGAR|nr:hypothetical protein NP233_g10712 [Leucocoprinus birnbaumii]
MGLPEFSWRNVIHQVFGPRKASGRDTPSPPATPMKMDSTHLRPAKSFTIFRSSPPRPSREFTDDTSSFMSPMPRELRSPSFDGTDISHSSSDDTEEWNDDDEADSVRQSFIDSIGILKYFPEPPVSIHAQSLPSRRFPGRLFAPPAFLKSTSSESSLNSDFHKKRALPSGQSPIPYTIRHGPVQFSTTSIPFDLISRTHRLARSSSARSSPSLNRSSSYSSSETFGSSPVSHCSTPPASLARSHSCNLLFRSRTPEPALAFRPKSPLSQHLSTSQSLQDLRPKTPDQPQSLKSLVISPTPSSPPSSFRLATVHVPGLEFRVSSVSPDIDNHAKSGVKERPVGGLKTTQQQPTLTMWKSLLGLLLLAVSGYASSDCTGTINSLSDVTAAVACTTVNLNGFQVPGGQTLNLNLLDGTTVNMNGDISFAHQNWAGPLFQITGNNIKFNGNGHTFDGNGPLYWDGLGGNGGVTKPAPMMKIRISGTYSNVKVLNSPARTYSVSNPATLVMDSLTIDNSLGDQPNSNSNGLAAGHNTDGFDASTTDLTIQNSVIMNQDDCLAINRGSNIIFKNNHCSGGHGISVGSIDSGVTVNGIVITGNTITNNDQALRIKTDATATGSTVTNITYSGNTATGCKRFGVIIDQSYPSTIGTPGNGVKLSGVNFVSPQTSISVNSGAQRVAVNCGVARVPGHGTGRT